MRPQRARTSKTHPLIFDAIKIGEGVVGMTICPGKKGASIYGAPWDRSLELDGQQIAAWKATSLVTLMREPEFPELGLSSSSSIGSAAFIDRHYQVPVHDLRAPCYDPFNENILIIKFQKSFVPRRGRINCSLNDNGKWRWFGTQFTVKKN